MYIKALSGMPLLYAKVGNPLILLPNAHVAPLPQLTMHSPAQREVSPDSTSWSKGLHCLPFMPCVRSVPWYWCTLCCMSWWSRVCRQHHSNNLLLPLYADRDLGRLWVTCANDIHDGSLTYVTVEVALPTLCCAFTSDSLMFCISQT